MTALPVSASESAVRGAVERLAGLQPGPFQVVSCYLKLEPRDKARAKYLIKIKNRIKQVASDLGRRPLDHAQRESVSADLARLRRYFEEPSRLPSARGRIRRAQSSHAHSGGEAAPLRAGGRPDLPDPHAAPPRGAGRRGYRRGRGGAAAAPAHLPSRPRARRGASESQARGRCRGAGGGPGAA